MPKITFKNTNQQAIITAGGAIKDATKDQGWPIAYGCEDGVCGTCIVKVAEGKENISPMEEQEAQTLEMMCMNDGEHRLCCQCKANGDVAIEGM